MRKMFYLKGTVNYTLKKTREGKVSTPTSMAKSESKKTLIFVKLQDLETNMLLQLTF